MDAGRQRDAYGGSAIAYRCRPKRSCAFFERHDSHRRRMRDISGQRDRLCRTRGIERRLDVGRIDASRDLEHVRAVAKDRARRQRKQRLVGDAPDRYGAAIRIRNDLAKARVLRLCAQHGREYHPIAARCDLRNHRHVPIVARRIDAFEGIDQRELGRGRITSDINVSGGVYSHRRRNIDSFIDTEKTEARVNRWTETPWTAKIGRIDQPIASAIELGNEGVDDDRVLVSLPQLESPWRHREID